MSVRFVRPDAQIFLGDLLSCVPGEDGLGDGLEAISRLAVAGIEVDTSAGTWTLCLQADGVELPPGVSREALDGQLKKAAAKLGRFVPEALEVRFRIEGVSREPREVRRKGAPGGADEDDVILGRPIRSTPVDISSITGGEKESVTIKGTICDLSAKRSRSGDTLVEMVITDKKDSIFARAFFSDERFLRLSPGMPVMVRGRSALDKLSMEPFVLCHDICLTAPEVRTDDYPEKRVELHLHTKMSALDSVLDLEKAIERAALWGHGALAITDHGVVQAFPEAEHLGKKYGVKVIYGLEGYLVEDGADTGPSYHITLLVKDQVGLKNLYRIVTESHLRHFYRTPRIPRGLLSRFREGILVGSACEAGEVFQALLSGRESIQDVASFYDYLEIQPVDVNAFLVTDGRVRSKDELALLNKKIVELGRALGIPVVMTGDAHYLDPEDEIYRRILLSAKGMEQGERPAPLHFRSTAELIDEARSYLDPDLARLVVVENPRRIAEQVAPVTPVRPGLHCPRLDNQDELLRSMAEEGIRKLYGPNPPPLVKERFERELRAIIGNGYAPIYLIAAKMVAKSESDGYMVGSRGSVGSSLVARAVGITEVNPLPPHYVCPECYWCEFPEEEGVGSGFDLPPRNCPRCGRALIRDGQDIPFETFMGFGGDKVPDIDLNFSGEEQQEMFKFVAELLGEGNVFRAGTISTVATKTAFGFVKHFAEETGKKLRRAEEIRLVKGIEGVKRTTGQHPGGVMVVPRGEDVLDFTPLQYPADDKEAGAVTTHFDYESIQGHLIKVDILGHDDPTVLKMLQELTGVDPRSIPMDDPETMKLFSGENPDDALGIPEFGTRFVRTMLAETRPATFADLVRISGLSHGTDVWANNARDLIREGKARLSEVIATREDIFLYLMKMGLPPERAFAISEKVRKGKPLDDEDISLMREKGVPDWYIQSCRKISYLFPKAHAVAYVTTAFRIAWYKKHYPEAFYAAYFSFHGSALTLDLILQGPDGWRKFIERVSNSEGSSPKDEDIAGALEVCLEMESRGISFGKLDLYASHPTRYLPRGKKLLPPLISVPGLGAKACEGIATARSQGRFSSIEDLRKRAGLTRRAVETLKQYGCLEGLGETDQLSLLDFLSG
ncbi:MAG: PolC-type DNA polymerase III [Firmicutes bacterium]|nr:PolC-type DNA polymerase III [Candidatus Fermentithermobacillaceae bacterium]